MHFCHQQGIIHRVLKPANILLERIRADERSAGEMSPVASSPTPSLSSFLPKITDFGLAKRLDDPLGLTRTGVIAGPPAYMAPEQMTGRAADIGPATDIYALGVILYEVGLYRRDLGWQSYSS
jgi:serine/threonine protein kinase